MLFNPTKSYSMRILSRNLIVINLFIMIFPCFANAIVNVVPNHIQAIDDSIRQLVLSKLLPSERISDISTAIKYIEELPDSSNYSDWKPYLRTKIVLHQYRENGFDFLSKLSFQDPEAINYFINQYNPIIMSLINSDRVDFQKTGVLFLSEYESIAGLTAIESVIELMAPRLRQLAESSATSPHLRLEVLSFYEPFVEVEYVAYELLNFQQDSTVIQVAASTLCDRLSKDDVLALYTESEGIVHNRALFVLLFDHFDDLTSDMRSAILNEFITYMLYSDVETDARCRIVSNAIINRWYRYDPIKAFLLDMLKPGQWHECSGGRGFSLYWVIIALIDGASESDIKVALDSVRKNSSLIPEKYRITVVEKLDEILK